MSTRVPSGFNDPIINEKLFLEDFYRRGERFPEPTYLGNAVIDNPRGENHIGQFVDLDAKKYVTADVEAITRYGNPNDVPTFRMAGPRRYLHHHPHRVKAAIVTTGGVAPGLNSVIHSIVKQHYQLYDLSHKGKIFGIHDSFFGACSLASNRQELVPRETEKWLEKGGSMLGMRRYRDMSKEDLAKTISNQLSLNDINILYVIGGDGSLSVAHEIAERSPAVSVVGIPKTMDNDVMFVWETFGFKTTVEKATDIINALNSEAESSRRVCLIELFGAESGFVAANAALASGHVDLVMIPEEFQFLSTSDCELLLTKYIAYIQGKVKAYQQGEPSHAVVVIAEGVAKILKAKRVVLGNEQITDDSSSGFLVQLCKYLNNIELTDTKGNRIGVFFNRPRHYIRANAPNPQDKIYCEQLGALAVDNALAGFTDFMISQWLTSFVLVPLRLVANRHRRLSSTSVFWKRVINSVGQPSFS
ncbi:MAG: hypothetical protein JWM21_3520 [Acidobacteria bacterium]|nr:hypothetical protein [Acidobacteriota bacterium]